MSRPGTTRTPEPSRGSFLRSVEGGAEYSRGSPRPSPPPCDGARRRSRRAPDRAGRARCTRSPPGPYNQYTHFGGRDASSTGAPVPLSGGGRRRPPASWWFQDVYPRSWTRAGPDGRALLPFRRAGDRPDAVRRRVRPGHRPGGGRPAPAGLGVGARVLDAGPLPDPHQRSRPGHAGVRTGTVWWWAAAVSSTCTIAHSWP